MQNHRKWTVYNDKSLKVCISTVDSQLLCMEETKTTELLNMFFGIGLFSLIQKRRMGFDLMQLSEILGGEIQKRLFNQNETGNDSQDWRITATEKDLKRTQKLKLSQIKKQT